MWIRKAIPWVTGFCLGSASVAIFYKSTAPDPLPHNSMALSVSAATVAQATAPLSSGPIAEGSDSEFEARLTQKVTLAVQAALTDWFAQNNGQGAAQSATHAATEVAGERPLTQNQQGIYDSLRARLREDAQSGLTWGQLTAAPEMTVQMLNSGELNPNQFLRPH
jgi:hypothetical protein